MYNLPWMIWFPHGRGVRKHRVILGKTVSYHEGVAGGHPDRLLSFKEALGARFIALVDGDLPLSVLYREEVTAGWDELEVRLSLSGLLYLGAKMDLAQLVEDDSVQEARKNITTKIPKEEQ